MALVRFGCILLLITPSAAVLSVCIGVFGCGWPISVSICRKYTASFALINKAPSAAEWLIWWELHHCWGGIYPRSIRKNVLQLGFVIFSCLHILRRCEPPISFYLHCVWLLHPLVLNNNLTVASQLPLFPLLVRLAWLQLKWVKWGLVSWLHVRCIKGFPSLLGCISCPLLIVQGSHFFLLHTVSSLP